MQTRKDLLQAHRLMTQRAGLALIQGEADTAEQPLRRINVATFAGVMIAVLAVAAFWLIGLLTHSGGQLPANASGTVVMDDTGQAYVWCGNSSLCPAVNYASALLYYAGTATPGVRKVSQGSLAQFHAGPEVGIPGLPAPLPVAADLVQGPWSVCVRATTNAAAGPQQQQLVTLVAGRSTGGQPLGSGQAIIVHARGQNQDWIIWNGQRMAIGGKFVIGTQLGSQPAVAVPASWLDSLSEGPAFAPPAIPGAGQQTQQGPNGPATIGQVYKVQQVNGTVWYVQESDGVAQISQTQAALLTVKQGQPAPLSLQAATQHPSAKPVPSGGLPRQLPTPVAYNTASPLCVTYGAGAQTGQVTVNGTIPSGALAAQPTGGVGVDYVWLPAGAGALVTASGQGSSPYFLVTGARRYALAGTAVAAAFGYDLGKQRAVVPANIINLIPQGPAMDPAKARLTIPMGMAG